jgi:hypothetical protein
VRKAIQDGVDSAVEQRLISVLGRDTELDQPVFCAIGADKIIARGPMADGTTRTIERISAQELDAGILIVLRSLVASSRSDLIEASARAFGYARTGETVFRRLNSALDRLLASGRIAEKLGSLVVPS